MSNTVTIINGDSSDQLSCFDRGLLYGDGLFETIAVKHGVPMYWPQHLKRLQKGCQVLALEMPKATLLEEEVKQIIAGEQQCIVKIIITRGIVERGYKPGQSETTRVIQKFKWLEYPKSYFKDGVVIKICNFCLAHQPKLARIKHLNRLEQVLASTELDDAVQEGLVCDYHDNIIEATASNIFFEMEDELITPDLSKCGVEGVLRNEIIGYCHQNKIPIKVRNFKKNELPKIKAMILTNCVRGVWPVKQVLMEKTNGELLRKTAIIDALMSKFND